MKETILANSRSVTPYKQRRCRLTVWSSIKPWPVATTGQTSSSTAILLRLLSASSPSSVPTLQRATLFFPQAPSPECLTVMVVACQPGHSKPTFLRKPSSPSSSQVAAAPRYSLSLSLRPLATSSLPFSHSLTLSFTIPRRPHPALVPSSLSQLLKQYRSFLRKKTPTAPVAKTIFLSFFCNLHQEHSRLIWSGDVSRAQG